MSGYRRAKFKFEAENDDEITFSKGVYLVVESVEDDWCTGYVVLEDGSKGSATGLFPENYCEKIERLPWAMKKTKKKKSETVKARAAFAFEAENDDELSFRVGDIIVVTDQGTEDPEWWSGQIGSQEGLFPASYVKLIVDGVSSAPKKKTVTPTKAPTNSITSTKSTVSTTSSIVAVGTRVVITFGKRKGVKAVVDSKVKDKKSRYVLKLTSGENKGRKVEYPEKKFTRDEEKSEPPPPMKKKEKSEPPPPMKKKEKSEPPPPMKKKEKSEPPPLMKKKEKSEPPPPMKTPPIKTKTTTTTKATPRRSSPPPPPPPQREQKEEPSLGYVKALYAFEGETEDEIDFEKGEILRLLNTDNDDWWGGERLKANAKGEIESGFFPRTYVKKCDPPQSSTKKKVKKNTSNNNNNNNKTKQMIESKHVALSPNTVNSFDASQFSLGQPFPIWVHPSFTSLFLDAHTANFMRVNKRDTPAQQMRSLSSSLEFVARLLDLSLEAFSQSLGSVWKLPAVIRFAAHLANEFPVLTGDVGSLNQYLAGQFMPRVMRMQAGELLLAPAGMCTFNTLLFTLLKSLDTHAHHRMV